MSKIVELRPNKNLLNKNFEKYQFSPDNVAVTEEKSLSKDVYRQEPLSGQDSWLEARLFGFHNHLFKNPFDDSCWFCDDELNVWKLDKHGHLHHVHTLSSIQEKLYNPTITFASEKITILTSGTSNLEFLITSDDGNDKKSFIIDGIEPGVLLDSKLIKRHLLLYTLQIIVTMCLITDANNKKKYSKINVITFSMDYENSPEKIVIFKRQELMVNGPVDYVFIESNGEYLNMLSQDSAKFKFDSLKIIENKDNSIGKIPKYCWSQDDDSITVWIKIPEKYSDKKANVKVTKNVIIVDIEETVLIQGETQFPLDAETTTWSHENDALKLELIKSEAGQMWSELIKGDTGGECLPNETLAAEIHSRLAHLCTDQPVESDNSQPLIGFNAEQLEQCDLEGKENYLQRINLINHSISHLAMLGAHNHVIFTHRLKSSQLLCIRHDHDGCVWSTQESTKENWKIDHTYTFPGFGYVEASKRNKKFCVSPPKCQYVAIIEHTRHAFIYERPENNSTIAKQKIFDLGPNTAPIMGAAATNDYLILLTKNKLYQLKVT